MMSTQDAFIKRIRTNLQQSLLPEAGPEHPPSFHQYSYQADAPPEKLIKEFSRELRLLSGYVHTPHSRSEVASLILEILGNHQVERVLAWAEAELGLPGLEKTLVEAGIRLEDSQLPADKAGRQARLAELDGVVAGLSGAQAGLADTGSLVVISGPGRPRLASLLPPLHLALLPVQNLYPSLPAFLAAHTNVANEGSNLVFITGPSRTADIEMTLSMGVHGPKEIHAIIIPA